MKRESSKLTIPCQHCHGTGRAPLAERYSRTLAVVKELGNATSEQVHQRLGASSNMVKTAANNWLEALRKMGFVRRRWKNRGWVYRAT